MLEKGKISSFQLFSLVVSFIFGSSAIFETINLAGRDTWLSEIIGIMIGVCGVIIITYLAGKFPGLNLAEYSEKLFGRVLGTIINILYAFYFLFLYILILRNFGDLMTALVMPETSMWFFNLTFGLLVVYLVKNRIEIIGRSGELILPISIFISLTTSSLIYFSHKPNLGNLLPLMENGVKPILLGAIPVSTFPYLELIAFAMILPYVNVPEKNRKVMIFGVLFGGFIITQMLIQNISIFGEYIATLTFPRFFVVRLISVGEFLERIEAFVLAIWILSGLIKMGVSLYASVLIMAHSFRLSDYNFLVLPCTIISVVFSVIVYGNVFEMLNFSTNIYPVFAIPFQIIFPVMMVILAAIRFRKSKNKQSSNPNVSSKMTR